MSNSLNLKMLWATNLCRLCAQVNSTSHQIFNDDAHNNKDITGKIKKCLNLDVSFKF